MTTKPVEARVQVTVINGFALAALAVGDAARLNARSDTLKTVFKTMVIGPSQTNPALTGVWYKKSYYSSNSGYSGSNFNTSSTRTTGLYADGTCAATNQMVLSAAMKDYRGDPSGSANGEFQGDVERGRWAASADRLYILWNDGTLATWRFHVQGPPGNRAMVLYPQQGEKDLWTEDPNAQ